ncbi:hypothetical protein R3P38DRAFT_1843715 [Favolaschia claudopus]|uniref:NACHT domain-containing protein n=1 Tax=Favolaschia claudopus TaxID=2862362 RepID=A0AAW0A2T3_9AGAR
MKTLKAILARRSTRTPRPNPTQSQSARNATATAISADSADSTHQKPPSTIFAPTHLRTLKSGLILLLTKVEPMLDGSPFKIPFNVINTVIDLATTVSGNNDHLRALFEHVSQQVDTVNAVLPKTLSADGKARIRAFSEYLVTELADLNSLAERSTLKKILESDEDIEIIESAMKRIDRRLKSFHLEITMSIENKIDSSNIDAALRILYNASASDATHDAGESFTHPPCHPNTRLEILDHLTTWSQDTSDFASQILWMHGPAGTGKSAIAQSLCEELQAKNSLAGSFFFKRGHPSRGNAAKLWPTIAYQLALISPSFKVAIALRLTSDPAIVDKSLPVQLQRLLIDPYHDADALNHRSLIIVIDGLDECEDEARQQEILRSLAKFSQPTLHILIVSRPEVHIKQLFSEAALSSCARLTVQGSLEDVEVYLTDEFKRIRETHSAMASISCPWPEDHLIRHIIDKSSGHFVYAATVIRFVEDNDFDPVEGLVFVTRLQPQEQNPYRMSPFFALDELYLQILGMVPYRPQLSRVLSVIAAEFTGRLSVAQIGQLLGLKPTDIFLTIRRLHPLIKIDDRHGLIKAAADQHISVYHASFLDFLRDPSRSRNFHFSDIDRQHLATDTLEALSQNSSHSDELDLPHHLIACLPFITTVRLTPELITLLYCIKLDLILSFNFPVTSSGRFIEWLELHQAPHNLIQEWAENFFLGLFNARCYHFLGARRIPPIPESDLPSIDYVRSTTSSDLIRIMHMYRLGSLLVSEQRLDFSLGAYIVAEIHQLSDKDIRSIISATRSVLEGSDNSVWDAFLWSVAHPTRIRDLHPDPSLEITAIWCLNRIGMGQRWLFIPSSWSYILRSCPPTPHLLNVLRSNEEHVAPFINDKSLDSFGDKPPNPYHHWHNILNWLQTFTDLPIDMLEYVKNHLPADYDENDAMWVTWRDFTGWSIRSSYIGPFIVPSLASR